MLQNAGDVELWEIAVLSSSRREKKIVWVQDNQAINFRLKSHWSCFLNMAQIRAVRAGPLLSHTHERGRALLSQCQPSSSQGWFPLFQIQFHQGFHYWVVTKK